MRQKNSYYIFSKAPSGVHRKLQALGFIEVEPHGMGAGPEEIKEVIIAWVNLHPILSTIFFGVLANRIDKFIDVLVGWYLSNPRKKHIKPVVQFFIYPNFYSKDFYQLKIRIDRKYSKRQIIEELEKAIRIYKKYLEDSKKLR